MPTVLFVHGTGTRDPSYSQTFDQISAALRGHAEVKKCYWGGSEGTILRAEGASIPRYASTREIGATRSGDEDDSEDYSIALWKLLADDPLFELRLIASAAPVGELAPGLGDRVARRRRIETPDRPRDDRLASR
jgi:hypothetical protein